MQSPSATASEVTIKWTNDIAGFPAEHKSTFPKPLIDAYLGTYIDKRKSPLHSWMPDTVKAWKKKDLQKRYLDFDYNRVLTDDEHLLNALRTLKSRGFIFLQNIPKEQQNAPLELGNRIGRLRDTFYGLTWDVKSVAKAKNVAYTHQFLGFHMDLLYFANPPGYQMLQCIQNSCEGGASMFVDSFAAAMAVRKMQKAKYEVLKREDAVGYHYHNNGEHYRFAHPVIETWGPRGPHEVITNVNYSPPFQAPFVFPSGVPAEKKIERVREMRNALETFAKETEKEEYIFEHKLAEGEMVLFNNRRVLHARREFEPGTGERWLKGGYIDTDVVMSKLRVLSETVGDAEQMKVKEDRIEDSKAMSNDAEVSEVVEEKVDEAVA